MIEQRDTAGVAWFCKGNGASLGPRLARGWRLTYLSHRHGIEMSETASLPCPTQAAACGIMERCAVGKQDTTSDAPRMR